MEPPRTLSEPVTGVNYNYPLTTTIIPHCRIVSATLLTSWQERPFVAFMFTAPQHQGRGLARAALLRVMNRLAERGDSVLRLVVTQGNASAERLYERLGFSPEAQPPLTTA